MESVALSLRQIFTCKRLWENYGGSPALQQFPRTTQAGHKALRTTYSSVLLSLISQSPQYHFVVFLLGSVIIIAVRFLFFFKHSFSCFPAQTQIRSGKYIYKNMLLRVCNLHFGLVPDHLEHLHGLQLSKSHITKISRMLHQVTIGGTLRSLNKNQKLGFFVLCFFNLFSFCYKVYLFYMLASWLIFEMCNIKNKILAFNVRQE